MDLSIFEVLGPVMIGPSSSHTAGAAKLARAAAAIAAKPFFKVRFALSGSFAKTGVGHGTHEALLAGAMGLREDDERLRAADRLALKKGIAWEFCECELEAAHENTVRFTFFCEDGTEARITGSSLGGGRILITEIDGLKTEITTEQPTIVVEQNDKPGVVSAISRVLAEQGINIGVMRVSRTAKGETAACVIETDSPVPQKVAEQLCGLANVRTVRIVEG